MPDTALYPLLFAPIYKDYLWGGTTLRDRYRRLSAPLVCAESWELSDRPEGMSIVENGSLAGTPLRALMESRRREVVGPAVGKGEFPLLIKILDARERLSVQVHPNDVTASRFGGEAKTEMWHVLHARPGAAVYAGLKDGAAPATLRDALQAGTVEAMLNRVPVNTGDTVYIPGGRVHAIGEGCLMLEAQQNSNTTYRLFDWGRVGPDGKPRTLHVEEALQVVAWEDPAERISAAVPLASSEANHRERVLRCPYFDVERWRLGSSAELPNDRSRSLVLFAAEGDVELSANGVMVHVPEGRTGLIPAQCESRSVSPAGRSATVITIVPA